MMGKNMSAPKMKLEGFGLDGLTARCEAEGCTGVVVIERSWETYHINPDRIRCMLCGQRYEIDTHGLAGWPLEEKLRRYKRLSEDTSKATRRKE